ncbi:hypothetical protein [Bacillus sp. EAC]|uniref:hypothetical protein n=1 Tax=Bacillus sp. EAC TaxID=1978338 RepID=UPI000B44921F|nr:hypothetical protein [Bacillus sp. EAC]
MLKEKCIICDHIYKDFHKKDYFKSYDLMKKLVETNEFTFVAGSCPLNDLYKHLDIEDLYTIEHYFKCKCGRYFYTGCCIRGTPILKVMNTLPKKIEKTISGRYGTYFNVNKNFTSKFKNFINFIFKEKNQRR